MFYLKFQILIRARATIMLHVRPYLYIYTHIYIYRKSQISTPLIVSRSLANNKSKGYIFSNTCITSKKMTASQKSSMDTPTQIALFVGGSF